MSRLLIMQSRRELRDDFFENELIKIFKSNYCPINMNFDSLLDHSIENISRKQLKAEANSKIQHENSKFENTTILSCAK